MSELKPLIDQLTQMVKEGYDLGKDQIPEVGKQLLKYTLISNSIIGALEFTAGVFTLHISYQWFVEIEKDNLNMDGRWLGLFILIGIGFLCLGAFLMNLSEIFKITIAPKVFLLDFLHNYLE